MFEIISHLLSGLGLASASGLNAYIPLLVVSLTARFTPWLKLNPPYDVLTHDWVIAALVILLLIETVVDKIPAADTINDLFQTFVRPTAGALLFAASTNTIQLNPVIAVILGLVLAFGVHAAKATARPVVTATTAGIGNPVVSVLEDVVAAVVAILSVLAPVVGVLLFALIVLWVARWFLLRRRPARA